MSFLSDRLLNESNVPLVDGRLLYTSIAMFFTASVYVSFVGFRCGSGGAFFSESLEVDDRFNGLLGRGGAGLRRITSADFSVFCIGIVAAVRRPIGFEGLTGGPFTAGLSAGSVTSLPEESSSKVIKSPLLMVCADDGFLGGSGGLFSTGSDDGVE